MPKKRNILSIHQAFRKAEADLRLERCTVPKWGTDIFDRVKNGEINLETARKEIHSYVCVRLTTK
jgi:hypothetical protein